MDTLHQKHRYFRVASESSRHPTVPSRCFRLLVLCSGVSEQRNDNLFFLFSWRTYFKIVPVKSMKPNQTSQRKSARLHECRGRTIQVQSSSPRQSDVYYGLQKYKHSSCPGTKRHLCNVSLAFLSVRDTRKHILFGIITTFGLHESLWVCRFSQQLPVCDHLPEILHWLTLPKTLHFS